MTPNAAPDVERYVDALAKALPIFTADEQRAAVALYRQLAKGHPVTSPQLATALNASAGKAKELLERPSIKSLTFPDELGRVVGFGGLTVAPMQHKLMVNGRTLWTWCAWDSLFLPELLGATAQVESADPHTGELVRLEVAPNGVRKVAPDGVVVSFLHAESSLFAESAANIVAKFCHFVFFFATRTSGERWVQNHPATFLYSLADAVTIARRINARSFGLELARLARHAA
ncbi:MAG: organomercurial lyase [Gemmatimonadaceae bacterium]